MTLKGEAPRYFREVVMTYEGDECLPWPYACDKDGYGVVRHEGRLQRVPRLACEAKHGPPPTPAHEAAHSCGKGHEGCCTKRHLSWKTRAGNEADKIVHGTHNRGERHGLAKLTEADARQILALKGHVSQGALGRMFGVGQGQISAIHRGRFWSWLNPHVDHQKEGINQ